MATLGEMCGWRKPTEEEAAYIRPILMQKVETKKKAAYMTKMILIIMSLLCLRGVFECLKLLVHTEDLVLIPVTIICSLLAIFFIGGLFHQRKMSGGKKAVQENDWIGLDVTFESKCDNNTTGPVGSVRDRNGQVLEGTIGRGKKLAYSVAADEYFNGAGFYVRVPADLSKECIMQFVFRKKER